MNMHKEPQEIETCSRRSFLIATGIGLAASAMLGAETLNMYNEKNRQASKLSKGKDKKMEKKVLIAYATKCRSTEEIAQAMGRELASLGAAIKVENVKNITNVDSYETILIGSPVRMGSWLPEAQRFVNENRLHLNQVSTSFFTVHTLALDDSEESKQKRKVYTDSLHKIVTPKKEIFFGGAIIYSRLNFLERLATKAVKAPEADYRNWDKIREWAHEFA